MSLFPKKKKKGEYPFNQHPSDISRSSGKAINKYFLEMLGLLNRLWNMPYFLFTS